MTNQTNPVGNLDEADLEKALAKAREANEEVDRIRKKNRGAAIAQCQKLIADFDLQRNEIFEPDQRASVKPKYRGPNGETWAGRGNQPKWVQTFVSRGGDLDSLLIETPDNSKDGSSPRPLTGQGARTNH
jgi:DNA-binding protein H-NS